MKYSTTEYYANATLSSQVICCKHNILYVDPDLSVTIFKSFDMLKIAQHSSILTKITGPYLAF